MEFHNDNTTIRYWCQGVYSASVFIVCLGFMAYPYLPTPPLGQDMTQGQFLNGV